MLHLKMTFDVLMRVFGTLKGMVLMAFVSYTVFQLRPLSNVLIKKHE